MKQLIKTLSNIHRPDSRPNIFLFSIPRGGSTWFMELVSCQSGFRYCSEPLDVRQEEVRKYSDIKSWKELYDPGNAEKFDRYIAGLVSGAINFRNPNPLQSHYRFLTNRVVFKLIHGGVDRANWLRDNFNGRVMLVLRHPIAVSISRKEYPFLRHFLDSEFRHKFTVEQCALAEEIINSGSKLEQGVLAWCIHHAIPLQEAQDDWAIVTYEQAVLEPQPLIDYLCEKLVLRDSEKIISQLNVPSRVMKKSDDETQVLLQKIGSRNRQNELVTKWQRKVDESDAQLAMGILKHFNLDVYSQGSALPSDKYWVGDSVPALI